MRTLGSETIELSLKSLDAPVDLVNSEQVVIERLLLAGKLERLTAQATPDEWDPNTSSASFARDADRTSRDGDKHAIHPGRDQRAMQP